MDTRALRQYIREILTEKKRKSSKPGGPRTDFGATWQLNPGKAAVDLKVAVDSAEGDVAAAADSLEVAPRTLYHYLETEPSLERVKTTADKEDAKEDRFKGKD